MPGKTSSFHPFCLLSGCLARMRGQNLCQTSTSSQMGEVLFASMRILQYSTTEHCHCLRHTPVHERKPSPSAQNQGLVPPMGRRSWLILIRMLDLTINRTRLSFQAQQISTKLIEHTSPTHSRSTKCNNHTHTHSTTPLALGCKTLSILKTVYLFPLS